MIDEVVKRFPEEPRVALLRASQLQQAGETDKALSLLHDVEPKTRQDPELRNAVAIAYDSLGQPSAAERVLAFGPQDVQTWGMRASLLAKQGDKAALSNLYNELSRQAAKPDPAQRLLLGKIAEYLKRYPEAVQWYHSVPGGDELSEARLRAANAQALAGRLPLALDEVHAIQSDAVVDDDVRRDAYLLEAELRQRADDSAGELDALARGLAAYPDDNGLLYARALTWERRDDIPRAEADLRKILVTDPENVPALNALGYTLADRTGRLQEALELIDRARVAEPDNAAIVDSYGWVLYRLGRKEEALVQLRRAWTLAKDPEIAAHVGEVLWVLGKQRGVDGMALVLGGLLLLAFGLWLFERNRWTGSRAVTLLGVLLAIGALVPAWGVTQLAAPTRAAQAASENVVEYSPQLLDRLRADNRVVFVNMTADWCVSCKANERAVLSRPEFKDLLKRTNAVYMRGDYTNVDPQITSFLEEHKAVGVPLYVVYGPGAPPTVLPTLLTQAVVEEALLRTAR
ncbi:hypothetical protein G6F35_008632 [Rhizopus arrhizus]|nr:hypothetical protein G6F35_008632 [Rhizopus arrhizus]